MAKSKSSKSKSNTNRGSHTNQSNNGKGGSSTVDQSYQQTMAQSLQEEQIFPYAYPDQSNHLPGDGLAKYGMQTINSRSGYIKVTLDTISGTYPLVPRSISHQIPDNSEQKLIGDLISVQIQNDMQNDIPTCTFIMGNTHDWSSLISVNDLIRVDYIIPYEPGDGNSSGYDFGSGEPDWLDQSTVKNPTFPNQDQDAINKYNQETAWYQQQAPTPPQWNQPGTFDKCLYTGLVSDLTRNDNFASNQETYTIVGQGMAKIMSNIQLSTFSDLQSNLNGYQLLPDDEKTGIGFKGHTSANIVKQIINRFVLQNQGGVNTYDYLASQNGEDITTRASAIPNYARDLMGAPMTEDQYEQYMDAMADAEQTDDSSDDKDSDDDSDKNNDDNGGNKATQTDDAVANLPEEPWLNIPLAVNAGDELPIQNLIEFYIYENLDESYPDAGPSNPFINYNGSILQMIKDVSSKPFNEMYWTHNRGIATFNYRPTPFDPENWKALPITEIAPSLITDFNIGTNDQEQAAVFKITPTNGEGQTEFDGGWAGDLAPLTNLALVRRYGYKLIQAQTDYFNGAGAGSSSDSDSDSDDKDSDSKDSDSKDSDSKDSKSDDNSKSSDNNSDNGGGDSSSSDDNSSPDSQIQNMQTAGTQGADSEAMKGYTAEMAAQNYPPYTSIVDAFEYAAGRHPSSGTDISIPKEVGGISGYDDVNMALHNSSNEGDFARKVSAYGIDSTNAASLWTLRNGFNRTRYLQIVDPNYVPTSPTISRHSRYLKSYNRMKQNPEKAASELMSEMGYTLGPKQAYDIVQAALANGGIPPEGEYDRIISGKANGGDDFTDQQPGVTGGVDGSQVPFLFLMYTRKLFNWNADNAKFYSGTITCHGLPDYGNAFIGERLIVYDDANKVYYEFYCEGVKTQWDFTNGLQVTFDVTRGVPLNNDTNDDSDGFDRRFSKPWSFWGQSTPFRGGYFGEQDLATAIQNASSGNSDGGGAGSDVVAFARKVKDKNWTYSQPDRTDFGEIGHPKEGGHADCSSFGWYCYKSCGYDVGDSAFTTISCAGVMDKIDKGDTKSGDAAVTSDHFSIMEEKWHGMDTQIIDMNLGENIAEEPFQQGFGSRDESSITFYRAKGGGGSSKKSKDDDD